MRGRIELCMISVAFLLTGCDCTHKHMKPATCNDASVCVDCGATQGEPLGHNWQDATCTTPKTCSNCGEQAGEPLGHTWQEATCTRSKTCLLCGVTDGKTLGHSWEAETCTQPETCSVCGLAVGEAKGHTIIEWTTVTAATCTEVGKETGECVDCKEVQERTIAMIPHQEGEWEIVTAATDVAGKRARRCNVCKAVLVEEAYTLTEEEMEAWYKSQCQRLTYEEIARNPDKYQGTYGKYTGEVIQVLEDGNDLTLRVNITQNKFYWSDTIIVTYHTKENRPRILEDDIITLYGVNKGIYTYESIFGANVSLPRVDAKYIDAK